VSENIKPGDRVRVWWSTGERDPEGNPLARVTDVLPYVGTYPDLCDTTLVLTAPDTRGGTLPMAWDTRTATLVDGERPYWRQF
jgi:hypothetical protein